MFAVWIDKGAESGDPWLCGLVSRSEECVAEEDARLGVSMESVWSVLSSILAATPLPAGRHIDIHEGN